MKKIKLYILVEDDYGNKIETPCYWIRQEPYAELRNWNTHEVIKYKKHWM